MTIRKALRKLYHTMCGGTTNKDTAGDLINAIADDYQGGGGGGGAMIVTLTEQDEHYVADKTAEEIAAAYQIGEVVITGGGLMMPVYLVTEDGSSYDIAAAATSKDGQTFYSYYHNDAWEIGRIDLAVGVPMPYVTPSDAGKVPVVNNSGNWTADALTVYVTLTPDDVEEYYHADKTSAQIAAMYAAKINVYLVIDMDGTNQYVPVTFAGTSGEGAEAVSTVFAATTGGGADGVGVFAIANDIANSQPEHFLTIGSMITDIPAGNAGQVLGYGQGGALSAMSVTTAFVVTLTPVGDSAPDTYTADKTAAEVAAAMANHMPCYLFEDLSGEGVTSTIQATYMIAADDGQGTSGAYALSMDLTNGNQIIYSHSGTTVTKNVTT